MRITEAVSANNSLKLLLLLIAILLNLSLYTQRIDEIASLPLVIVYLVLFSFSLMAMLAAAFTHRTSVRIAWGLCFMIAGIAHDANVKVMADYLGYDNFVLMLKSIGFVGAALQQYGAPIILSLPANLLLFIAITLPPANVDKRRNAAEWLFATTPASVILALSAMLFMRGGMGSNGLPSPVIVPSLATLYAIDLLLEQHGPRQTVSLPLTPRTEQAAIEDIVLLIDESVRGDYLDINHPDGIRSGLDKPPDNAQLFNFGLAASATNCSVGSNLILRFGGQRPSYRSDIRVKPSIWAYARRAGFSTIYMDAQSEYQFFNGMNDDEIAQIDQIIQFKETIPRDRDLESAKVLAELLGDGKRQFILVNKLGGHFPVHDKFPDDYLIYQPVLSRGDLDASKPIIQTIFGNDPVDWQRYKNAYRNTLLWSVGHYFEVLFAQADLSKALIIYTSDHGQNFHERGQPGTHTHCASGKTPSMEEGVVPLVAIVGNQTRIDLPEAVHKNMRDSVSHYSIFATLLTGMGYQADSLREQYGPSLFERHTDPMTFNTRFEARLGMSPEWHSVMPEQVLGPPSEGSPDQPRP